MHPRWGWEQSGGEVMPTVAGIVCRLLGRRRAGTRPAPTGPLGCRHCWLDMLLGKNEQGG